MPLNVSIPTVVKHAFGITEGTATALGPSRMQVSAEVDARPGDTLELRLDLSGAGTTIYASVRVTDVTPSPNRRRSVFGVIITDISAEDARTYARWLGGEGKSVSSSTAPKPAAPAKPPPAPVDQPVFAVDPRFAVVACRWSSPSGFLVTWNAELRHRGLRVPFNGAPPLFGHRVRLALHLPDGAIVRCAGSVVLVAGACAAIELQLAPADIQQLRSLAEYVYHAAHSGDRPR